MIAPSCCHSRICTYHLSWRVIRFEHLGRSPFSLSNSFSDLAMSQKPAAYPPARRTRHFAIWKRLVWSLSYVGNIQSLSSTCFRCRELQEGDGFFEVFNFVAVFRINQRHWGLFCIFALFDFIPFPDSFPVQTLLSDPHQLFHLFLLLLDHISY